MLQCKIIALRGFSKLTIWKIEFKFGKVFSKLHLIRTLNKMLVKDSKLGF